MLFLNGCNASVLTNRYYKLMENLSNKTVRLFGIRIWGLIDFIECRTYFSNGHFENWVRAFHIQAIFRCGTAQAQFTTHWKLSIWKKKIKWKRISNRFLSRPRNLIAIQIYQRHFVTNPKKKNIPSFISTFLATIQLSIYI